MASQQARRVGRDRLLLILLFLVAWEAVIRLGAVSGLLAAAPTAIVASMLELGALEEVRAAFIDTIAMFLVAFSFAAVGGVLIGALLGLSRWAYRVFHPMVVMLFSTPKLIFLPLFLLVFGIGFTAKVAYGTTSGIFPVIVTVTAGIRVVDDKLLTTARSLGASRWQMIRHVLLPGSVPAIFAGLWYGIKHALLGVLIMELFVSQRGLGFFISRYTSGFDTDRVFALILAVALFAIGLGTFWHWIEHRLSTWRTG